MAVSGRFNQLHRNQYLVAGGAGSSLHVGIESLWPISRMDFGLFYSASPMRARALRALHPRSIQRAGNNN